jgi:hypothetical protein
MTDELNPYQPPESETGEIAPPPAERLPDGAEYSPWKRGRVYVAFILGTFAAEMMIAFFHPVFAAIGLGCGIPAVIVANKEIAEYPQSATHGFIVWGKRCGWIGIIVGAISVVVWIVILVVGVGLSL